MGNLNYYILIGALLFAGGIAAGGLSSRLGLPVLLVFLLVGMLAGENGPGGIVFNDYSISFAVGNLALAVILFDGGFRTSLSTFRIGLRPALVLATVGVAVTAVSVGAFGAWLLGLDWRMGLLLGAIVSSTDAAAVFSLLGTSGLRLNERVGATLEIESGANDPMAIFLTTAMIGVVQASGEARPAALALAFVQQFGIGAAGGWAAGLLVRHTLPWWPQGGGPTAILLFAIGLVVFALVNLAGGSGFLAIYLFGLAAATRQHPQHAAVLQAMDSLAWLAQAGMFLLLGLLVTPLELVPLAAPALLLAAFLMLVARPAAVWLCLAPFRFGRRETAFVAWVGLRGAVPIVLALFPLLAGIAQARLLFNIAFAVVLVSLLVQGATLPWAARRFGVALPPRQRAVAEHVLASGLRLAEFSVAPGAAACGAFASQLALPEGCRLADICRGRELLDPEVHVIQEGDVVGIVGPEQAVAGCTELFGPRQARSGRSLRAFTLQASAPFAEVAGTYGLPVTDRVASMQLGDALEAISRRRLIEGDEVRVGRARFVVQQAVRGRLERISLRI